MTLDFFIRLLDTFGADFRRWPEDQRAAAQALRDASSVAREKWEAAQRLDALFSLDRARQPDAVRVAAITNAALRRIRNQPEQGFDWRWLLSRPLGAAMATTVLAGLAAGFLLGPDLQPLQERGVPAVVLLLGYGAPGGEGLF